MLGTGENHSPPPLFIQAALNALAFGFVLLSNLISVPIAIHSLGLTHFGEAALYIALCSPIAIVGGVVGQALIVTAGPYLARGDTLGAAHATRAAIHFAVIIVAGLAAALVCLAPFLLPAFRGPDTQPTLIALAICTLAISLKQISLVLQYRKMVDQTYRAIAVLVMLATAAELLAIIFTLSLYPTVIGYLSALAIGSATGAVLWRFASTSALSQAQMPKDASPFLREIIRFSTWRSLSGVAVSLLNQADTLMLGLVTTTTDAGRFSIANRLHQGAATAILSSAGVLLPHFSRRSEPVASHKDSFVATSWAMTTLSAALYAPIIALAEQILHAWVTAPHATGVSSVLLTLLLAGMVGAASNTLSEYSVGSGAIAQITKITLVYALGSGILTIVLVLQWGYAAAGYGLLIGATLRYLFFVLRLQPRFFPSASIIDHAIASPVPLISAVLIGCAAHNVVQPQALPTMAIVVLYIGLSTLTASVSMAILLLSARGRQIVRSAMIAAIAALDSLRRRSNSANNTRT